MAASTIASSWILLALQTPILAEGDKRTHLLMGRMTA
ncbi:hypothetical protein SNOG_03964 [Parastagonospora nodorum SN15]|uniref:Uncharacterized protein n=1 Tax=Phaeosphaeria nodorum (strain SN15 / ATCC MYA-4574 / FGSC 10173) TaxID=321614 RepID=Q0UWA0_PHANO|nr:hypothetical protein SNOG_03964 [Parastagonospora nodorum SN15]EAT89169.1 hypothetical protein SNOG_03964 [Parastagonospora nodorum SN15]